MAIEKFLYVGTLCFQTFKDIKESLEQNFCLSPTDNEQLCAVISISASAFLGQGKGSQTLVESESALELAEDEIPNLDPLRL